MVVNIVYTIYRLHPNVCLFCLDKKKAQEDAWFYKKYKAFDFAAQKSNALHVIMTKHKILISSSFSWEPAQQI